MTIATVELAVRPESIEEAARAVEMTLRATRAQDGCDEATVLLDPAQPGQLVIFERWESVEHQRAYLEWRAGPGADNSIGAYVTAAPVIRVFEEWAGQ